MFMYDIIKNKRDGKSLSEEEINFFIEKYTLGQIPDYQASALLMAIYFNKMTEEEILFLTKAIVNSGDYVDLSKVNGIKVDKHSTGGVGDSVTLILGPMIAACEVPFVKMSGRGLGHTGGTLDKLEAIDGFKVDLSEEQFIEFANKSNIVLCSQTGNITPADKKIYALRDVTATVDSLPLIASSVMSKKLAIGSDGILLDVKVGSGAFMKTLEEAELLANEMTLLGNNYGKETKAILTNMDEPLGNAIGNTLEVIEAIDILNNKGPEDLKELSLVLGSHLLLMAKNVKTYDEAYRKLEEILENKKGLEKLIEMVENQGGDSSLIKDTSLFKKSKYIVDIESTKEGYVKEINAEEIGKCSLLLGAGRATIDSEIDLTAGLVLHKKVDDYVGKNDIICTIHTNNQDVIEEVTKRLRQIYIIGEKNKSSKDLILRTIG